MAEIYDMALYHQQLREAEEAEEGINAALVELGRDAEQISPGWWVLQTFPELAGRTVPRAWLDGDRDDVRALIVSLYDRTHRARKADLQDAAFMDDLRQRLGKGPRPLGPAASA